MQGKEQEYKKFAFRCVDTACPVTFKGKPYEAIGVAYRRNRRTGNKTTVVELYDLNGCDSMMTAGLEEFYRENCKGENNA